MAKRAPCSPTSSWEESHFGDCSQHLRTGECPAISGINLLEHPEAQGSHKIGAAYEYIPVAIISGNTGGSNATGFVGYGRLDANGFVVGLDIESSGWHFTSAPVILFSGAFRTGVKDTFNGYKCSDLAWDDPHCVCSGRALIAGNKIYDNVTLIPPQCSPAYDSPNWMTGVNGPKYYNICTEAQLNNTPTDNFGRCPANAPTCMTSWESGWGLDDCSDGVFEKTNNHCFDHGSSAPAKRCQGDWILGGSFAVCGKAITQTWKETDEYLDFGVCKKRGYKNVMAMKSWHGELPFIVRAGCISCDDVDDTPDGYTFKYLRALTQYSHAASYSDPTPCWNNFGHVNLQFSTDSRVGRLDGKVTVNQKYHYDNQNWTTDSESPVTAAISRCDGSVIIFHDVDDPFSALFGVADERSSDFNSMPWNFCDNTVHDDGCGHISSWTTTCVRTSYTVAGDHYIFTQERSQRSYIEECAWHDCGYEGDLPDEEPLDDNGCCKARAGWHVKHNFTFHSVETLAVQLSEAYDYTTLNSDANHLLDQWNLLDDLQYPWKTTEDELTMPKVTYCEAEPTSPLLGSAGNIASDCPGTSVCRYYEAQDNTAISWNDCQPRPPWPPSDPNTLTTKQGKGDYRVTCNKNFSNLCLGNCEGTQRILGGPAPVGHFGSIDFYRVNQEEVCCTCDCQTVNETLNVSFGGVSPLHHATQWPTKWEQKQLYFGAFESINDTYGGTYGRFNCSDVNVKNPVTKPWVSPDVIIKVKYAEVIQLDKPSENSGLPCGLSSSPEVVLANKWDQYASGTYATNCAYDCGCTDPEDPCTDCTGGPFKLRWSDFSARNSGCGPTLDAVSGEVFQTGAKLVFASAHGAQIADYVNAWLMCDSLVGETFSGTYYVTKILSSSGLQISGVFGSLDSVSVTGWVDFPTGENTFDNYPKGDFIVRNWTFNGFTGAQASTDIYAGFQSLSVAPYCVPFASCEPAVVVISHAGSVEHTDDKGRAVGHTVYVDMPNLVPQVCGSRINYIVQQYQTDPLWQRPSQPCCLVSGSLSNDCADESDVDDVTRVFHTWEEDDGSCTLDRDVYEVTEDGNIVHKHHHYFPMRPFVEARLTTGYHHITISSPCAFIRPYDMVNHDVCLDKTTLFAMFNDSHALATLDFWGNYYSYALCPVCIPPFPNEGYWSKFSPWLLAAQQEECVNAGYPRIEETNHIVKTNE